MPNLARTLKEEITRLARRAVRSETGGTKKAVAQYRREIARLKRTIHEQSRRIEYLERQERQRANGAGSRAAAADDEAGSLPLRFSAKGLKSHRQRLGLSAHDFAKLVGVSALTIYNWEHGKAKPRRSQLPKVAAVRKLGAREAKQKLASMK